MEKTLPPAALENHSDQDLLNVAKETMRAANESLLLNQEDVVLLQSIVACAHLIKKSAGRLITTGMGKSGLIARKAAATLTSTGTPAMFLHPADALHGDMGNIQANEVVLAFSNSGETRELLALVPHIRTLQGKLIAVTRNAKGSLVSHADASLIYHVTKEGCPLQLAPMASTTVALCVTDALAAALIRLKGFQSKDFGRFHPSGVLGKRLLTRVVDVMQSCEKSVIGHKSCFKELLNVMVSSNLGAVVVKDDEDRLLGIVADGDIKRLLDKYNESLLVLWKTSVTAVMIKNPVTIGANKVIEEALALMHEKKIYVLPVVDKENKPIGIIRMHELVEFV